MDNLAMISFPGVLILQLVRALESVQEDNPKVKESLEAWKEYIDEER